MTSWFADMGLSISNSILDLLFFFPFFFFFFLHFKCVSQAHGTERFLPSLHGKMYISILSLSPFLSTKFAHGKEMGLMRIQIMGLRCNNLGKGGGFRSI